MAGRADPFADNDDLDLSDFAPAPAARPKIDAEAVRAVSEKHKFKSREAKPAPATPAPPAKIPQRRRRTGRNQQLNLKVTPEIAQRFADLADSTGAGLAETFEAAVDALERLRLHESKRK